MRRKQPTPSSRPRGFGGPHQRVAAVLGLLALGFLLTHVHPGHDARATGDAHPAVSDDASHHDHSVHVFADTAPCLGCPSSDAKTTLATRGPSIVPADLAARIGLERTDTARAPFSGLPATRAPPIG